MLCFGLQYFMRVVRLLLDAVSINGLSIQYRFRQTALI